MVSISPAELVGYLASALVVISLAMTSLLKLRILNLAGAITFVGYGFLIDSIPIIITNVAIVVLNMTFLARTARTETLFRALEVEPESAFVEEFLRFYQADIARIVPEFTGVEPGDSVVWLLRDAVPAGILVGRVKDGAFAVALDYVIRPYRDMKLGRWLYGRGVAFFKRKGVTRIETMSQTDIHCRYLERMGFSVEEDRFVRYLD